MGPPLSLKGRALALLAQREQSVVELRRKLTRHAQQADAADAKARGESRAAAGGSVDDRHPVNADEGDDADPPVDIGTRVDAVIGWLRQHDYLSEDRFVESRVHARSARLGQARIRQELAQHGLALPADLAASLRATEFERAADVWRRKFGKPPADLSAQAKQTRFLMARGFPADVVRRLVRVERVPHVERHADAGDNDD